MKFAARLLSFILCFELIIGGYGPSVLMSSIAMAGDCPAGTSMDATLNRCLTSNQVASIKMAVASCTSGTTEDQQKCYQNNAQAALDSEVNAGNAKNNNTNLGTKSPLLRVGTGAAIAVPLFLLAHNLFKKKAQRMVCKPASLMLMYAGAGVLLGGEVLTYVQHKNRLSDMKDRWKEIATPKADASADGKKVQQTEAQSQAFEFLAQNEDSIAKTANTKFIYYASAAGLFAAGAVMAVVEKVKLSTAMINANLPPTAANATLIAQAKVDINRITCNVTKGEAANAKACDGSGGTYSDGKCACVGVVKPGSTTGSCVPETDPAKLKAAADNKTKSEFESKPKAEQEAILKQQAADKLKAETNLKQSETEVEKTKNAYDEAATKQRDMIAHPEKYKPSEIETNNKEVNSTKSAWEKAQTGLDNNKSALNNITNPGGATTVSNPPPVKNTTPSVGGNQAGSSNKKSIDLFAVAQKGLGFLGGGNKNSGGENKGNKNPTPPTPTELCKQVDGVWDGTNCTCADGKTFDEEANKCISNTGTSIETFRNFKLKKTAEYNLEQSRNAYELLELSKELENIEFENYSRLTNYDDVDTSEYKKYTFGGLTNKALNELSFIKTAHAQEDRKCTDSTECDSGICNKENSSEGWCAAVPASDPKPAVDDKGKGKTSLLDGLKEIVTKIFSNTNKNATGVAKKALETTGDQVDKAIGKPLTRAAINGVFGTWIGIMSADFKEQANISKKRADVLRGMKDEFASNGGITNCTDAQRNSTARTDCYCYTSAGQRNPARANSKICQQLWGTFSASSTDYLADNSKVCLDLNSNVDASCACRTQKGTDGKNTCMKASAASFNLSGLSTGSFKMLSAGTAPAADLTSGVASAASINGAATLSNAMRVKAAADDMLKSTDPAAAAAVKKMSDGIASSALSSTAGLSMGGSGSGSSMANMTPAQAVKSLDEELKKGTTQNITTSGSSESIGSGNAVQEKLEFGMTTDDLAIQETQIAEVMGKELDMDQADINKGSDTNLFEVLSNRYQRSGMRRLFDADGKTKADEPAKSDINQ